MNNISSNLLLYCLKITISFYLFTLTSASFCQNNVDTIHISEVTIVEKYMPDIIGLKVLTIDSATLQNAATENISTILTNLTTITVKAYGAGGNTSTSFRGAGANHTQFLWNGININSTMLGQADMNMLPNFFTDNISIYHGGASLSGNSGALGGSIHITNKPDWTRNFGIDVMQSVGSWNTYGTYLKTIFGNRLFHSTTRLFYNNSDNNYLFKRYDGGEDLRNNNAQYNAAGLIQEFYWKPNGSNNFSAILLMQQSQHYFQGAVNANFQENTCGRTVADWTFDRGNFRVISRVAFVKNYLQYISPDLRLDSRNTEQIITGSIDAKLSVNEKVNFSSGLGINQSNVFSNNYLGNQGRMQGSASVGVNGLLLKKKLSYLFMLKQELYNELFVPIIPSAGVEYLLFPKGKISLKSNISRNFHMPSMNDLYWNPGGNPNLKPEEGYFFESGILYNRSSNDAVQKFSAEATFFYAEIFNNIIWIPSGYASYWHAQNLKETRSEGIETHLTYAVKFRKIGIEFSGNYSYTSAINKTAVGANDMSTGKQLIYVPYHSGNASFQIRRSNVFFNYIFSYTGIRYIYADNSWYLPPNMLSDMSIGGTLRFQKIIFTLQGTVANIMNADYQAVAGYPMMRRNYRLTLRISI